jgi:hypothetical protein
MLSEERWKLTVYPAGSQESVGDSKGQEGGHFNFKFCVKVKIDVFA